MGRTPILVFLALTATSSAGCYYYAPIPLAPGVADTRPLEVGQAELSAEGGGGVQMAPTGASPFAGGALHLAAGGPRRAAFVLDGQVGQSTLPGLIPEKPADVFSMLGLRGGVRAYAEEGRATFGAGWNHGGIPPGLVFGGPDAELGLGGPLGGDLRAAFTWRMGVSLSFGATEFEPFIFGYSNLWQVVFSRPVEDHGAFTVGIGGALTLIANTEPWEPVQQPAGASVALTFGWSQRSPQKVRWSTMSP